MSDSEGCSLAEVGAHVELVHVVQLKDFIDNAIVVLVQDYFLMIIF